MTSAKAVMARKSIWAMYEKKFDSATAKTTHKLTAESRLLLIEKKRHCKTCVSINLFLGPNVRTSLCDLTHSCFFVSRFKQIDGRCNIHGQVQGFFYSSYLFVR